MDKKFTYTASIYIKLKVCLSVCLSAIETKLETFRYKQTYESYITFSREAKYGILISIRIVYGGLRAYIYSTYINSHNKIQKNSITNHKQNVRKAYILTFLLERDLRKQLRACLTFLSLPVYIPSRERTHRDRLPVIIPARDRKS